MRAKYFFEVFKTIQAKKKNEITRSLVRLFFFALYRPTFFTECVVLSILRGGTVPIIFELSRSKWKEALKHLFGKKPGFVRAFFAYGFNHYKCCSTDLKKNETCKF